MAANTKTKRTPSEITLKAQMILDEKMTPNATPTRYIAGYRSRLGKHLALERCRDSIFVWTEATYDGALPEFQARLVRRYPKDKTRNSNLNQKNASRLMIGNPADYWEFTTLPELERFIDWYHAQ